MLPSNSFGSLSRSQYKKNVPTEEPLTSKVLMESILASQPKPSLFKSGLRRLASLTRKKSLRKPKKSKAKPESEDEDPFVKTSGRKSLLQRSHTLHRIPKHHDNYDEDEAMDVVPEILSPCTPRRMPLLPAFRPPSEADFSRFRHKEQHECEARDDENTSDIQSSVADPTRRLSVYTQHHRASRRFSVTSIYTILAQERQQQMEQMQASEAIPSPETLPAKVPTSPPPQARVTQLQRSKTMPSRRSQYYSDVNLAQMGEGPSLPRPIPKPQVPNLLDVHIEDASLGWAGSHDSQDESSLLKLYCQQSPRGTPNAQELSSPPTVAKVLDPLLQDRVYPLSSHTSRHSMAEESDVSSVYSISAYQHYTFIDSWRQSNVSNTSMREKSMHSSLSSHTLQGDASRTHSQHSILLNQEKLAESISQLTVTDANILPAFKALSEQQESKPVPTGQDSHQKLDALMGEIIVEEYVHDTRNHSNAVDVYDVVLEELERVWLDRIERIRLFAN